MAEKTNLTVTNFISNENVILCPKIKQPEYAFIGRSNVGKSSLINMILAHKIAHISSTPGKTQLINHILINDKWSLVDLPGYGYAKLSKKKKAEILKMTKNYFQKRGIQLVSVFMLIDIRIPPQKIDLEWMEWLTNNNIYFIRIFTKSDGLRKSNINKAISQYNKVMSTKWEKIPETLITSSKNKDGRNNVLNKIIELNKLFQNI